MENEVSAEDIQDATYMADIDDEDLPEDDFEGEDQEDDEVADDEPDENEKRMSDLEKEIEDLKKDNARLGYALRKTKPEDKKEDKETPFTKADLMKLYKEHYDDPDVVFQIMEEMTKMGKVDAQAAAEKGADIKNKQSQIDHVINALYPDAKKEGSELHEGVQEAVKWAHLEGHPFADTLGLALLFLKDMPETIKRIQEETKKQFETSSKKQLESKAEEARKDKINKGKLSKSGKSSDTHTAVSLTPKQRETANRLGFKSKEQLARYAKILGNKSETVHAEA